MWKKFLTFSLLCLFALASVAYAEDPATPAPEAPAAVSEEAPEAAPAGEETPEAAVAEEPPCQALPSDGKVLTGWDPATCGSCGTYCSSDNLCKGKLFGDPCGNNNQTCQARTGCALFNCCTCV